MRSLASRFGRASRAMWRQLCFAGQLAVTVCIEPILAPSKTKPYAGVGKRCAFIGALAAPCLVAGALRSPLVHGHEIALVMADVKLPGTGNLLLRIREHLLPLSQPANRAWNGKKDGEHRGLEAHGLVDDSRVKVYVGIELTLGEVFIFQRDPLQLQGNLQLGVFAGDFEDLVGGPFNNPRARIIVLVDPVAESHQLAVACLDALN